MRSRFWLVLSILALAFLPALAQKGAKVPKRPKLPAGADTNDAAAYWHHGQLMLANDPWEAGDAFFWAIQINPTWADGYYGRWVALLLADPDRLAALQEGDAGAAGKTEVRQIDSLRLKALTLNPFLFERLERTMIEQSIAKQVPAGVARGQVELELATMWNKEPYSRAISAYTRGNFPVALAGYDTAIANIIQHDKDHPPKPKDKEEEEASTADAIAKIHLARGKIFYLAGNYESAYVELTKASLGKQLSDKKHVVRVYESKAILQQSIGLTFERLHKADSAREAYGRALLEDLSYAPAHLALSSLALSQSDTAQALTELDLATQMSPNDPATAYTYGRALIYAGKDARALEQLKHSVELDKWFAAPHALMAFIYDGSDYREEALAEWITFLSLAVPNDPYAPKARERIAALTAKPADSTAKP